MFSGQRPVVVTNDDRILSGRMCMTLLIRGTYQKLVVLGFDHGHSTDTSATGVYLASNTVVCSLVMYPNPNSTICVVGVYVEDMGDSNTAKLYAGLLAVGDEILEVNGEKVASLSLDQVTYLLAQNPSTAVRVLRHRKTSSR